MKWSPKKSFKVLMRHVNIPLARYCRQRTVLGILCFDPRGALSLPPTSKQHQRGAAQYVAYCMYAVLTRALACLLWPRLLAARCHLACAHDECARWAVRNSRSVLKNDDAASRKVVAVSQPFRLDLGSIILHNTYSCFQKFPLNLVPK